MKFKNFLIRSLSLLLSFSILFISGSMPVLASDHASAIVNKIVEGSTTYLCYLIAEIGALYNYDFGSFLQNRSDFLDYWNEDNITYDEATDEITFSQDLIIYVKEQLQEYQYNEYGYQVLHTIKYYDIPVSAFPDSISYRTMCELVKTYGIIGINRWNAMQFYDLSPYLEGSSGFYASIFSSNSIYSKLMDYTSWTNTYLDEYFIYTSDLTDVAYSWEDLAEMIEQGSSGFTYTGTTSSSHTYKAYYDKGQAPSSIKYSSDVFLVSYDGCDVLVFNSATALQNYSVDKRGVFTTSGFYEDTGALTVSLDDLTSSIDDLTDLLGQFQDLLGEQGSGLTESQLEELLQKFLDEFFNRLDESGSGDEDDSSTSSGDSGSDIPDGFFDSVKSYYRSVLAYLSAILSNVQNLSYIAETSGSDDEDSTDLFDLIKGIFDDPEAGSQEAADELSASFSDLASSMTKKFPFSIPWDVYALFGVFAGTGSSGTQTVSTYSALDGADADTLSDGVQILSLDGTEDHDAPYFELPLVINSFGIEETVVIDLEKFQSVSTVSRVFLCLLFCVFLMKFTIKIVVLFNGGTDE